MPEGVSPKGFSYLSHVTQNIINGFLIIFKGDTPDRFDLYANIPDTLTNAQVDLHNAVGSGSFKTAYNLNGQPDLLMVLLESGYKATVELCLLFCISTFCGSIIYS
jgi:hypothetical protein